MRRRRRTEGLAHSIRQNQKVQRRKHGLEGGGDCDDLLIHEQRWAGGGRGGPG